MNVLLHSFSHTGEEENESLLLVEKETNYKVSPIMRSFKVVKPGGRSYLTSPWLLKILEEVFLDYCPSTSSSI